MIVNATASDYLQTSELLIATVDLLVAWTAGYARIDHVRIVTELSSSGVRFS